MIESKHFVFNPFQENTYLIWDLETKDGMIIDPGCSNRKEEKIITDFINEKGINLTKIFNTHLHVDHYYGNYFLDKNFNVEIYYSKTDEFLLQIMEDEAENYGVTFNQTRKADNYLEDLNEIKIGKSVGKLLFTPGHSPGEYSLYFENEKILFSGDVLFRESIGRTDIWKSDYNDLIDSINNKLFTLPNEVVVYPGHGESTTIGYEKEFNPFL